MIKIPLFRAKNVSSRIPGFSYRRDGDGRLLLLHTTTELTLLNR